MRAAVGLFCAALAAGVAFCQPRPARRADAQTIRTVEQVLARLETRVSEVKFDKTPLREALNWVGKQLAVNVWVRWKALADLDIRPDEPITLHARDIRLSQALWMILREASIDVRLRYGIVENILVISADDLDAEPVTVVYDIRPLLAARPQFGAAPAVRPGAAGGPAQIEIPAEPRPANQAETNQLAESLVEVITTTIEPHSWATNGGLGTIRYWNGRLIVYAGLPTHVALHKLLADLEATR